MPLVAMNAILDRLEAGEIESAKQLKAAFDHIMNNYDDYAYDWALGAVEELVGHPAGQEDIEMVIRLGREYNQKMKSVTDLDRKKDYDEVAQVGYGLDCLTEEERLTDFRAVRGE